MALQLAPDGQLAITGDGCGNIRAIATDTGAASWEATLPSKIGALHLTPDARQDIAGDVKGNARVILAVPTA